MKGQGRVFRPTWTDPVTGETRVSENWRLDYSVNGVRRREAANTTSRREALALLSKRIGGRRDGTIVGRPERVMFAEYAAGEDGKDKLVGGLRALVERQYVLDGNRSLARVQIALGHLERVLGRETKAVDITPTVIDGYVERRIGEGASRATCNYELATLRRAFRLAVKKRLLTVRPEIEIPAVENAREGFFSEADIAAVLAELPGEVRPVVAFLYATGWRVSEALGLTWAHVDRENATVRLSATETKGKKGRVFPYGDAPSLRDLFEARWAAREGLLVFHRGGKPIKSFRRVWARACTRANIPDRLVHDLRRSAARAFRRAGLSESDIMELCGWETPAMFRRYAIRDEQHLGVQVGRRFNGQVTAKSEAPASTPVNVS